MFKKLLIAALLLPFASIAMADQDGPNPGDDNPGSTNVTIPFYYGAFFSGEAGCFEEDDFCLEVTEEPLVPEFEGLKGKRLRKAEALAPGFASVACSATAEANSLFALGFEGGGELSLTRHGNHGAMHHIRFDAGLTAGTLTAAHASAEAYAFADATAVVAVDVSDTGTFCEEFEILDITIAELCATWNATISAESEAYATAESFADSEAFAASGAFGAVASHNEVWAANIEEYHASVATAAGSFSIAHAEAFAEATAGAYADIFYNVYVDACANVYSPIFDWEVCTEGWNTTAEDYASAYAAAYAEAQATAFAATMVEAYLPATYVNENGIYDTISFGPDAQAYALAALLVSCDAEAGGEVGDEPPNPD